MVSCHPPGDWGAFTSAIMRAISKECYQHAISRSASRMLFEWVPLTVCITCCQTHRWQGCEQHIESYIDNALFFFSGSIRRQSTDRVSRLCYDQAGEVLACQTTGKLLDFFK